MLDKILPLTRQFISIKSTFDNQKALGNILELALSNLKEFTIERFENNGVKSALIYRSKKRPKRFKIILNGHLDVIPGKEHQYKPVIDKNRLYGVGSMDMKASVVCLIIAFKEVVDKVNYPLGLQLVTDEQIGGFNGTNHQVSEGVRADFVISGEPTNLNIVNKAKGVLCLKVTCKGKAAHGAYTWRGKNAIWKMNKFLNVLEKEYPILSSEQWKTTVNLSKIETSNSSFNKIPDDCAVWLDIRFIPDDAKTILESVKKSAPRGFKVEVVVQEPALFVNESNGYLKKLQRAAEEITRSKVIIYGAHGSSDARHFINVNCNGIEFGPTGGNIGSDNEWVDIPSLESYCLILKNFLLSLAKRN